MASSKDVEKFGGKIVYNPDGSAYIIDDNGDEEDVNLRSMLPRQKGSIVENPAGSDRPLTIITDNDNNANCKLLKLILFHYLIRIFKNR